MRHAHAGIAHLSSKCLLYKWLRDEVNCRGVEPGPTRLGRNLRAVDNTVVVSVALLGSLLSSRGGSSTSGLASLLLLLLHGLTSAADTRGGNVVGVDVNGKELEGVAVDDALGGVLLGEGRDLSVGRGEVVDNLLADGGNVEDAVHQVSGPVCVELGSGDGVAPVADLVEVAADLEGERADDGLSGGVVTSPVASPLCTLLAVFSYEDIVTYRPG